ncbi:MAG: hypothetical protein R3C97_09525 [Geminicoccaceae bacterium]
MQEFDQESLSFEAIPPANDWKKPCDLDCEKPVIITAIIDDSCNITHPRFRDRNGTPRIDYTWLQDFQPSEENQLCGREINREELETVIKSRVMTRIPCSASSAWWIWRNTISIRSIDAPVTGLLLPIWLPASKAIAPIIE